LGASSYEVTQGRWEACMDGARRSQLTGPVKDTGGSGNFWVKLNRRVPPYISPLETSKPGTPPSGGSDAHGALQRLHRARQSLGEPVHRVLQRSATSCSTSRRSKPCSKRRCWQKTSERSTTHTGHTRHLVSARRPSSLRSGTKTNLDSQRCWTRNQGQVSSIVAPPCKI
jgi:hypothetical protein